MTVVYQHDSYRGQNQLLDKEFHRHTLEMGIGISAEVVRTESEAKLDQSYSELMKYVHNNVIGEGVVFSGPYGERAVVYCDYTASGRPLKCIEDYIAKYVYTYYANTHTTTCITAQQTTQFRNDAKMMIKKAVNASKDDVVIFAGSGTTAAVHKLIGVLQLQEKSQKTVVFISPFEHHSNLLPWKECGAEVVRIPENSTGTVNVQVLEEKLKLYKERDSYMVASFSAASNITGIITDTVTVTELCHKYGALSFWDYATAAPYLEINMNASNTGYKDAIFVSPHKFVGGPGSPGILIAKKSLFTNAVPHGAGGGTVQYVTNDKHVYVDDIESREEGGTPAIIESIRAGLCFQLKQDIGPRAIEEREEILYQKARAYWTKLPNIVILGKGGVKRLPIFSFIVRYSEDNSRYLHHNFLALLLNDMFGIQARGGCACAGPYAQGLLGVVGEDFEVFLLSEKCEEDESEKMKAFRTRFKRLSDAFNDDNFAAIQSPVKEKKRKIFDIMKPGFVRLNLPYFMNSDELNFVMKAVEMLSKHAWRMLPFYRYNPQTGVWSHRHHINEIMKLSNIKFDKEMRATNHPDKPLVIDLNKEYFDECLSVAQEIFDAATVASRTINTKSDVKLKDILDEDTKDLWWFLEPWQAVVDLALEGTHLTSSDLSTRSKTAFRPRQMSLLEHRPSITRRLFDALMRRSTVRHSTLLTMEPIDEENVETQRSE